MSARVKCPVKGCPGFSDVTTDGRGGLRDSCPCCERREAFRARVEPKPESGACEVCGGVVRAKRVGQRVPRSCLACRPIFKAAAAMKGHAKRRAARPRLIA